MDTVVYPLQNLRGSPDYARLPDIMPMTYHVDSLCSQLSGFFNRVQVDRNTFVWAVDTFTHVLRVFSDNLTRFVIEARLMGEQKPIPKHIREDFNTSRETYNRFLDDYIAFVGELTKQFRTHESTYATGGTYTETAFRSVYAEKPKEL
jgi:hypothetical protein